MSGSHDTPADRSSSRRKAIWKTIQFILLVATLALAGRELAKQWNDLRVVVHNAVLDWGLIALSCVMVLAVHAMLIQTWRILLTGWGSDLRFGAAIRIWTISNLGKYLPGKVWSIGAMGVLAQREGVSGVSAAGAALLNALLNLGAGFGVVAIAGASEMDRVAPWLRTASVVFSVIFFVGVAVLPRLLPPLLLRVSTWRGLPPLERHLPARTLWLVTALHVLSWIGYGLAFRVFAAGTSPSIAGAAAMFIAVYTASYLFGYLMIFAPGGIGAREGAIVWLLGVFGLAQAADATFLSLASRVWLTVVEVLPGLIALLMTAAAHKASERRVN